MASKKLIAIILLAIGLLAIIGGGLMFLSLQKPGAIFATGVQDQSYATITTTRLSYGQPIPVVFNKQASSPRLIIDDVAQWTVPAKVYSSGNQFSIPQNLPVGNHTLKIWANVPSNAPITDTWAEFNITISPAQAQCFNQDNTILQPSASGLCGVFPASYPCAPGQMTDGYSCAYFINPANITAPVQPVTYLCPPGFGYNATAGSCQYWSATTGPLPNGITDPNSYYCPAGGVYDGTTLRCAIGPGIAYPIVPVPNATAPAPSQAQPTAQPYAPVNWWCAIPIVGLLVLVVGGYLYMKRR